jgi:hypothetical protein
MIHKIKTRHAPAAAPPNNRRTTMTTNTQWLQLRIWAEQFEDSQKARIAATNRAERGGVNPDIYSAHLELLANAEHICKLHLAKCYRNTVPDTVRQWQQQTPGIGQHLLGRILGQLGHPVHATPHHWEGTGQNRKLIEDEPYNRSISQLWQYCGHGAPTRRTKGMTANELYAQGSPKLKMLVHLLSEACMKTMSSPYRVVYEQTRLDVETKTHTVECVRCGPSGKPAQPGSPWAKGHQHAHALRIVGKEILKDLWLAAGGASTQENPNEHMAESTTTLDLVPRLPGIQRRLAQPSL